MDVASDRSSGQTMFEVSSLDQLGSHASASGRVCVDKWRRVCVYACSKACELVDKAGMKMLLASSVERRRPHADDPT